MHSALCIILLTLVLRFSVYCFNCKRAEMHYVVSRYISSLIFRTYYYGSIRHQYIGGGGGGGLGFYVNCYNSRFGGCVALVIVQYPLILHTLTYPIQMMIH